MTRRARRRVFEGRAFGEDAVLIRRAAGSFDLDNHWVPGAENRTDVRLASWPTPAAEAREILPEGLRLSLARTFALRGNVEALRVGTDAADGDAIEYRSRRYQAAEIRPYDAHGFVEVIGIEQESSR